MIGSLRSKRQDSSTAAAVAAMKAPVPAMMPAWLLVTKKTASGPASISSWVYWFTLLTHSGARRVTKKNRNPARIQ